jgi:hypothetical protein
MAAKRSSRWPREHRYWRRRTQRIPSGSCVGAHGRRRYRVRCGSTHQPWPQRQNRYLPFPIRRFSCWLVREKMHHRTLPKSASNLSHRYLTYSDQGGMEGTSSGQIRISIGGAVTRFIANSCNAAGRSCLSEVSRMNLYWHDWFSQSSLRNSWADGPKSN